MSYTSESVLRKSASVTRVQEVIELLGYKKVQDGLKVPNRVAGATCGTTRLITALGRV